MPQEPQQIKTPLATPLTQDGGGNDGLPPDNGGNSATFSADDEDDNNESQEGDNEEKPTVSFSDFQKVLSGEEPEPKKKEDETKEESAEDIKEEEGEKITEETKQEGDKKPLEQLDDRPRRGPKPDLDPQNKRDYSAFDPALVPLLKKLPNQIFESTKKVHEELKVLKAKPQISEEHKLPETYYSHPEAYMLSPEFKTVQHNAQLAMSVAGHWSKQEISIRRTGKFQDLIQDKDGNLVVGELKEASEQDEERVLNLKQASERQAAKFEQKYESFVGGFKQRYEKDVNVIKQAETHFFPDYDKEDHPTAEFQKKAFAALPASFRKSELAPMLVKTAANNALLAAEVKHLRAEINKLKGIKQDTQGAPPAKRNFVAPSNNGGGKKEVTFTDFQKVLGRA